MTTPLTELNEIMEKLRHATGASRTTLRIDWPRWGAHADDVIAEARGPEVASLVGKTSIRQREAETVKWLERTKRVLVQEDCAEATPSPPQALLDVYGVRAQMLAPLVIGDTVVGWISVHEKSTRQWTKRDVGALEDAVASVTSALDEQALDDR